MKPNSKTDWERVLREAAADAPVAFDPEADLYDPNDPQAVAEFMAKATVVRGRGQRGEQKAPRKIATAIRLSPEVVAFFKAGGKGWQTRVDEALREYIKTHSPA
jgi:uncharacterized protein (DUF4415 family)